MITLRQAVDEYLTLRRDMGFKLLQAGQLLHQAVSYMEAQNASHLTLDLALQWAMQPKDAKPATWATRLMVLRSFARHHSAVDPCTEIPPKNILPYRPNRAKPYLYTEQDIERLMVCARALPAEGGWVGQTYACLLGLLAVTGMRIGEAISLEIRDVDLTAGILTIRQAKFGRSRLIPLHPSSQQALSQYAQRRDPFASKGSSPLFRLTVGPAAVHGDLPTGLSHAMRADWTASI
jgi:integrase/recombinase XerD